MEIILNDLVRNEVLYSQEGEEYYTYNKKGTKWTGHIWRRNDPLKTSDWREDRGKDRSDGKTKNT